MIGTRRSHQFCEIPGTDIEKEDLGRLEDGSLHFDRDVNELVD